MLYNVHVDYYIIMMMRYDIQYRIGQSPEWQNLAAASNVSKDKENTP